MDIFDVLNLIGGLCLFLMGMNLMGEYLEKSAGSSLKGLLARMTTGKMMGFITGLAVTAIIQSSSATTVMVVGFANSGIMTLKQAINVIMGANVGTTATAWILSLTGIEGDSIFMKLLKPSSFTPVLALIGTAMCMFSKSSRKKDVGMILLGFTALMYGMNTMSDAVSGLKEVPAFTNILTLFTNPVLGVLAGALLTAIIQSSSASVGILQALSSTGSITFGAAIPIIMGQNIGTCVTAMISSVGTSRNARRAALVHLSFNVIGTSVCLALFCAAKALIDMPFVSGPVDEMGIAVAHSVFNISCTLLLLPLTGKLEQLACRIVPDAKAEEKQSELDERLLNTPAFAIQRCREVTETMASISVGAMRSAIAQLTNYNPAVAETIREQENEADHYEDILGTYLVKLSAQPMSEEDSTESAKLLHLIGDFERISDHAVNLVESVEEIANKSLSFSDEARKELELLVGAVSETMDLALKAFLENDIKAAALVEPLEEVVDTLKEQLRARHIRRLQQGSCSIEVGFVWSDVLTNLERVADHCSNIAGCVIEMSHASYDLHEHLHAVREDDPTFAALYQGYANKYALVSND
ncbi:MAG: Na/Pi cotransporter family protein [Oscillospiraceae bacterium]|nr:Na/Pi cotransporter family protein [Oscillospiraceae bacterium]